jgi:amino acid permease
MLNTAIASGTLMVPYCYTSGIAISLLISVVFASLAFLSMHFMIEAAYASHAYDYHGLFEYCFGASRRWIPDLGIALVQLGSLMIYSHWNGRLLNGLVGSSHVIFGSNTFWIFLVVSCIVFPFTFFRSISGLDKLSILSSIFILLLISHSSYSLGFHAISTGLSTDTDITFLDWTKWRIIIAAFGVNCMAFNCHINYFSCLEALTNCTVQRAHILGGLTILVAFLLYNVFGLTTYLDLGSKLGPGSALEYHDTSDLFTQITTFGVVVVLIGSSPMVNWALRISVDRLFFNDRPMSSLRWVLIGASTCFLAAVLASTSDDVVLFFDVVGGLLTPMLTLLCPALFYLKCRTDLAWWQKAVACLTAGFTVIGAGACTYHALGEIISELSKASK